MLLARDTAALVRDARCRIIAAGAIASATLAPLVTGCALLLLQPVDDRALFGLLAWGGAAGAALGGLAVAKALPTDDHEAGRSVVGRTVGLATYAGAAYFPVLLFGFVAVMTSAELVSGRVDVERVPQAVFGIGMLAAMSAVIGAPLGAGFGVMFACATGPTARDLATPTHDAPQRASMWAAGMLVVAAVATLLPSLALEGRYCGTLFHTVLPWLEVVPPAGTDAAWTRYPVLAAPPSITALGFALDALIRRARTARWLRTIERGEHRELTIGDVPPGTNVLPLRRSDGFAAQRSAIVLRSEVGSYRTVASAIASIATPPARGIASASSPIEAPSRSPRAN